MGHVQVSIIKKNKILVSHSLISLVLFSTSAQANPTEGWHIGDRIAYSAQTGHSFHGKLITDSTANWTVNPD